LGESRPNPLVGRICGWQEKEGKNETKGLKEKISQKKDLQI